MGAIGNWLFGNAKSDWANASQQQNVGNWLQQNATIPGYQDMYNQGFGQDQANAYGDAYAAKMGIPGIIANSSAITSAQADNNAAAKTAQDEANATELANNAANSTARQTNTQGVLDKQVAANDATSKGVQQNILDTYGNAIKSNNDFTTAQEAASGDAYDKSQARLGTQMDFNNATSAQASAPAMAAVMRSLRAQGIDPNSPQGQAQIAKVNVGRAQSFDNNMANNIAASNTLTLGKQKANQDIATSGQANDQSLHLGQSGATNAESVRSTGADNAYVGNYGTATNNNLNTDLANQDQQLNNVRGATATNLANQNSQQTNARNDIMNAYNLNNTAYQQGVAAQTRDNTTKQTALTGLAGQENQAYGDAINWNGQATGAANSAFNSYNQDYQNQSKNAGWGSSLLGGLFGGLFG